MTDQTTQHIIFPWQTKRWEDIKRRLTEKINSIVDMDTRIASFMGKMRPRLINELFNVYYSDEQYSDSRVSQAKLINEIVPMIQNLVLIGPRLFNGFDSRVLSTEGNIVFTRPQVACLLSCIWFGLFGYNYLSSGPMKMESLPDPTLSHMYTKQHVFALQCLLTYFDRVHEYSTADDINIRNTYQAGSIILKRCALSSTPQWESSDTAICDVVLCDSIDDTPTQSDKPRLIVANAHPIIGSTLFGGPITQEEIMLLTRPECIVSMIFVSELSDNDALLVLGAEKTSSYRGFGSSIRYEGKYTDDTSRGYSADDTEVLIQCAVIFIDASTRTSSQSQLVDEFMRDLEKAYCGFSALAFSSPGQPITCGQWMSTLGGNTQVKFLQQLLAASEAGKSLIYCPTGRDFEGQVVDLLSWISRNGFTVGELFKMYLEVIRQALSNQHVRLSDIDVFMSMRELL